MAAIDILKQLLGHKLAPGGEPKKVRPRVVEGQPISANTQSWDTMPDDLMKPDAPLAASNPMAVSPLRSRISALENKDYSIKKDAEGNVVHRGKDRDAKWSVKDKIGSTLLGILGGAKGGPLGMLAGGLEAGTDRNYLEKRADRKELMAVRPAYQREQELDKIDLSNKQTALENDYLAQKPLYEQQKIDDKVARTGIAARRAEVAERTQDWREEDKKKYWDWEEIKHKAKEEKDDRSYELAVRKQDELERKNKVAESFKSTEVAGKELDRKEKLAKYARDNKLTRVKFETELKEKVNKGILTSEEAQAILAEFPQ